jgi:Protein of unknown function (DUF3306)
VGLATRRTAPVWDNEDHMTDRDRSTRAGADADEGFLRRWSRRKAEAQSAATAPIEDSADSPGEGPTGLEQTGELEKPAPVDPKDLPAIDTLDATSDYTVFMRPGVPLELRNQALRKLWRSDPLLANLDGLLEYGEDYSLPSWPTDAIRTAYEVGRGFVERISEGPEPPDEGPLREPAGTPAHQAARIAAETSADEATSMAVSAESSLPEAAAPEHPESPPGGVARVTSKRRRLPSRS